MFEVSSFNVFGLTVTQDDVDRMHEAFKMTYKQLSGEDRKWSEPDFCKEQLGVLWDSIVSFLDRAVTKKEHEPLDKKYVHQNLIMNTENETFLQALAQNSDGGKWLLLKLDKIATGEGSVRIQFDDRQTGERAHVVLDLHKMRGHLRKYSNKVRNSLTQFVDWIMLNRRTAITCILVSGITAITVFSGLWAGAAALPLAKVLVPFIIAMICLFAETVAAAESTEAALLALNRRGVRFQGAGLTSFIQ